MTNLQLLLTIGIPSVLVLLGWFQTNTRLGRLETQMDRTDAKIDRIDSKFDARFDKLTTEITSLRVENNRDMATLRDSIHRDMIALHERTAVVEARERAA